MSLHQLQYGKLKNLVSENIGYQNTPSPLMNYPVESEIIAGSYFGVDGLRAINKAEIQQQRSRTARIKVHNESTLYDGFVQMLRIMWVIPTVIHRKFMLVVKSVVFT